MRIMFITDDKGGCVFYRGWMPLAHLGDKGLVHGTITNCLLDYEFLHGENRKVDILGLQRPMHPTMEQIVDKWKPVMYADVDDNFMDLPQKNPCYHDLQHMKKVMGCDPIDSMKKVFSEIEVVTVSTPQLADAITYHTGRQRNTIDVIPNAVFQTRTEDEINEQRRHMLRDRKVTIAWWGGYHHYEDFEGLDELLTQFVHDKGSQINFIAMGWCPPALLESGRVTVYPWAPVSDFYETLFNLDVDICLGPLVINKFSKCKSDIKYLETAMFKRCFVGYQNEVFANARSGETAVLVETPDELVQAVRDLVDDPDRIRDIGQRAYDDVMANHLIEHREELWMNAFNKVMKASEGWSFQLPEEEHNEYIEKVRPEHLEKLKFDEILDHKCSLEKPREMQVWRRRGVEY